MKKNKNLLLSFIIIFLSHYSVLAQEVEDETETSSTPPSSNETYSNVYNPLSPVILHGPTNYTDGYGSMSYILNGFNSGTQSTTGNSGNVYNITTYSQNIGISDPSSSSNTLVPLDGSTINRSISIEAVAEVGINYLENSSTRATLPPLCVQLETMPAVDLHKLIETYNLQPVLLKPVYISTIGNENIANLLSGSDLSDRVKSFNTWLYGIIANSLSDMYPEVTINNYNYVFDPNTGGTKPNPNQTKTQYWKDNDGDGYGNPDITIFAYQPIDGYVENGDDCDDNDATKTTDCSDKQKNCTKRTGFLHEDNFTNKTPILGDNTTTTTDNFRNDS